MHQRFQFKRKPVRWQASFQFIHNPAGQFLEEISGEHNVNLFHSSLFAFPEKGIIALFPHR